MTIAKQDIIWISFIVLSLALIIWSFISIIKIDVKQHNICAEVYGDEQGTFRNWEGSSGYEYYAKYFNETDITCCIKESFLDSNGQIQRSRCTGIYKK